MDRRCEDTEAVSAAGEGCRFDSAGRRRQANRHRTWGQLFNRPHLFESHLQAIRCGRPCGVGPACVRRARCGRGRLSIRMPTAQIPACFPILKRSILGATQANRLYNERKPGRRRDGFVAAVREGRCLWAVNHDLGQRFLLLHRPVFKGITMKVIRVLLFVALLSIAVPAFGQNILYYRPGLNANADISNMVSDQEEDNGASITATGNHTVFEGLLHAALIESVPPWDLVLVSDKTIDTANDYVLDYLYAGNTIYILTTLAGGDVYTEFAFGGENRNVPSQQAGAIEEAAQVVVCFGIWLNERFGYPGGCTWTTAALTQARQDCDSACDARLRDCLQSN